MSVEQLHAVLTTAWVVWFFVLFGGIVAWVLWPTRRADFERARHLPLRESD